VFDNKKRVYAEDGYMVKNEKKLDAQYKSYLA
jgi:hypothetical protein